MSAQTAKRLDESARIIWATFVVMWFAFWLGSIITNSAGCSDSAKRDISDFFKTTGKCAQLAAANVLGGATRALVNSVNNAIADGTGFDSDTWKSNGIALATTFGVDTVKCAASELYAKSKASSADGGIPDGARFSASLPSTTPQQSYYFKATFESVK